MSEKVYAVSDEWKKRAFVDQAKYEEMYARSVNDPEGFWAEHGKRIDWIKPFTKVKNTSYDPHNVSIKWFEDGTTNVSMNCIDRHLAKRGDQVAIIWEGDNPDESEHITYKQLHERVSKLANVFKAHGVGKGDTVTIYLPMIPEAAYAMLACARIGAVHSIVFGGFSPDSLAARIEGCKSKLLITADEGLRGGRKVPLKVNADEAIKKAGFVETMVVVKRTGGKVDWVEGRDVWYGDEIAKVSADCPPVEMNAEDPLFMLYTSGSTGAPKGVINTQRMWCANQAMVRTMLRATARLLASPAECLRRVNQDLAEENEQMMFVTTFYGVLDLTTGQFIFVNAGHNPPVHITSINATRASGRCPDSPIWKPRAPIASNAPHSSMIGRCRGVRLSTLRSRACGQEGDEAVNWEQTSPQHSG